MRSLKTGLRAENLKLKIENGECRGWRLEAEEKNRVGGIKEEKLKQLKTWGYIQHFNMNSLQ